MSEKSLIASLLPHMRESSMVQHTYVSFVSNQTGNKLFVRFSVNVADLYVAGMNWENSVLEYGTKILTV